MVARGHPTRSERRGPCRARRKAQREEPDERQCDHHDDCDAEIEPDRPPEPH